LIGSREKNLAGAFDGIRLGSNAIKILRSPFYLSVIRSRSVDLNRRLIFDGTEEALHNSATQPLCVNVQLMRGFRFFPLCERHQYAMSPPRQDVLV
jgi:hypothetical protein